MKTAFVFLVKESDSIYHTEELIAEHNARHNVADNSGIDFFVIGDNDMYDQYPHPNYGFYINSTKHEGSHINKQRVSLDNALFLMCEIYKSVYEKVFFIESDVFVPSLSALLQLKESCKDYDLCTPSHKKQTGVDLLKWRGLKTSLGGNKLGEDYFYSMTCVVGMSRKMLNCIEQYAFENKTLLFHEVFFNTLAHLNKLTVYTPPELRTVAWQAKWSFDDYFNLQNNLFHPLKDFGQHEVTRKLIRYANEIGYQPNQKTNPIFLSKYQKSL